MITERERITHHLEGLRESLDKRGQDAVWERRNKSSQETRGLITRIRIANGYKTDEIRCDSCGEYSEMVASLEGPNVCELCRD